MPEGPDDWLVERGGFHGIPPALPETIDVVPEDLSQFASMLQEDIDTFHTDKNQAVDEMFHTFPSFRGDAEAGGIGGLPEGAAFEEGYWRVQSALSMLLGDTGMGLMLLQSVSTVIGTAYQSSDLFSPEFEGDAALAQLLGGTGLLTRPPLTAGDGEPPEFRDQALEQWEDYQDDVASGREEAEGSPDTAGTADRDSRLTETIHEGQPGEYVSDTDQDAVLTRDAGFEVREPIPYHFEREDLAEDIDLVISNDDWEHPLPPEAREQPGE